LPALSRLGAYGFRVTGVDSGHDWLVPQEPGAPLLTLERVLGPWPDRPRVVSDEEIDIGLAEGVWLHARADSGTVSFTAERPLDDDELIHPLLAPATALHWMWGGREALHAGAVTLGNGALLLLGDKQAGKSTTLAHLAQSHGLAVLSDDLAVLTHDLNVLAGPRSIDHRSGSEQPDAQTPITEPQAILVRGGERHRQRLAPAPPRAQVRGWAQLAWGQTIELEPLDGASRLRILAGARRARALRGDPQTLLELAALPAYRLSRPRSLNALIPATELLLGALG
jgi:hypothetical protein